MTVEYYYMNGKRIPAAEISASNEEHRRLMEYSMLCNDSRINEDGEIGDPTETALVRLGEQQGISEDELRAEEPRIFEIPFDSDRKRMSTLHQIKGEEILVSKGAADGLLPLSSRLWENGREIPMTEEHRRSLLEVVDAFSREGLRVLGFAFRPMKEEDCLLYTSRCV